MPQGFEVIIMLDAKQGNSCHCKPAEGSLLEVVDV